MVVLLVCGGCGGSSEAPDASIDASHDADSSDAPAPDAAPDAGLPRCQDLELVPWDLAAGVWSRDFGPRGLTDDGPWEADAWDLAWHDDSVYVVGGFTHAGPIPASNIAAWRAVDGWRALGAGVPEALTFVAVAPDGTVYAAATLTGNIHHYDGAAWSLAGTADGSIADLTVDADGTLLVSGFFSAIDGTPTPSGLARWNGSTWMNVAHPNADVAAIYVDADGLCIGGRALGPAGYVACRADGSMVWDEIRLSVQPGPPYPNPVNAIVRDATGALIVGGGVRVGGSPQPSGVVRWTGAAWELLGAGLGDLDSVEVMSMARAADDSLYAVGSFITIGSSSSSFDYALHVARFRGARWESIGGVQGGGLWPVAMAVVAGGADVYLGGSMTEAYPPGSGPWTAMTGIVRFDGSTWHALEHPGTVAHGPGRSVATAARRSCRPYVAGDFQVIEDSLVSHVGRLEADGSFTAVTASSTLDFGPPVLAVGLDGTVYAGASWFTIYDAAGGSTRAPLARTTSGEWAPFGTFSSSASVHALSVAQDGSLYVGGSFIESTTGESHFVRRDGAAWRAVGVRADPLPVTALVLDGATVYAAEALAAGGTRVSRFDGATWTVLGAPFTGEVRALAMHRGMLVAGGSGLVDDALVARFDGTAWESLGALVSPTAGPATVDALAVLGDVLVAGGGESLGDGYRGVLARLGAAGWEEQASFDGTIRSLTFTVDGLLIAGSFDAVNGIPSWGLALLARP
jgi:hypothetical protein